MGILDRALRLGEAKQFKGYEQRVARINAFEPEIGARHRRGAARARLTKLRERARAGETLDDLLYESFALIARGGQAHARPAPLRRADDRRHGAARRLDRRDEDRRGQDAHRHAPRRAELARRQRRPSRHGQRLPGPPRRRVDEADLRRARGDRGDPAEHAALRGEAGGLRRRRDLRHQLGVRVRLPARQHGHVARGEGPARRPREAGGLGRRRRQRQAPLIRPPVRDRRRGRQHPHRRGAHPADHLGRTRAGGRPVRQVRPPGAPDGVRQDPRRAWTSAPRRSSWPTSTSSSTRSTRRWRSPSAASPRRRSSSGSITSTGPRTAISSTI